MTPEESREVFDRLAPGWHEAKCTNGNHRVQCPFHDDHNPSLDIHGEKGVFYCRACGANGTAWDFAERLRGKDWARDIVREFRATPPQATRKPRPAPKAVPQKPVTDLGPATTAQTHALIQSRRLHKAETLDRVGARLVLWNDQEWLGFSTLADGRKLWAINRNAQPRFDPKGNLLRLNIGGGSLVCSPDLRQGNAGLIDRLFDAEGESDFIAAVEAGIKYVISGTTGAGSLAGHKLHRDWLLDLNPAEVVVVRDLDAAGRNGAEKVAEWWHKQGVRVRVLTLPEQLGEGGDLRDYLNGKPARDGDTAVEPFGDATELNMLVDQAELLEPKHAAPSIAIDQNAETEELARLSLIEYDQQREAAAKKMGIRVATLDSVVAKQRSQDDPGNEKTGGTGVLFKPIEPWTEAVDGVQLLDDLKATFIRFIVLPQHAVVSLCLWVLHAHAHDAAFISAILAIVSPDKRCGKTSLLALLGRVVPNALPTSNITPAALFRATEKWSPTLLVDEADSFLRDSEDLRGILNSGHNRSTAQVIRTVGEDYEPRMFGTWGPKAIALIGRLPDTLQDRSITLPMRRRHRDEPIEKLRADRDYGLHELARKAARWADDHLEALKQADPGLPSELNDRAADNWRPLKAIADQAGGPWPKLADQAAKALSSGVEDDSNRTLLLADIRDFWAGTDSKAVGSQVLTEALTTLPDRPWSECRRGKPLTSVGLAWRLKPFEIRPKKLWIGSVTVNGYEAEWFADAFNRYLPPIKSEGLEGVNENKDLEDFQVGRFDDQLPTWKTEKPNENGQPSNLPSWTGDTGPCADKHQADTGVEPVRANSDGKRGDLRERGSEPETANSPAREWVTSPTDSWRPLPLKAVQNVTVWHLPGSNGTGRRWQLRRGEEVLAETEAEDHATAHKWIASIQRDEIPPEGLPPAEEPLL